jgi:uncharacterized membrane protein YdjX (TVP38/TMEM64 family)
VATGSASAVLAAAREDPEVSGSNIILAFIVLYGLLNCIGLFYSPLSTEALLRKENADALKQYTLSFGLAAPVVFVLVQALQVIIIPIPGQVIAFIGGFVFGWRPGVVYTMIALTVGMTVVFNLSRRLGRGFVERLHGTGALAEFEKLFLKGENKTGGLYGKSKEAIRSHGLLTFFLIMLLPGFPDNLACLVAGLTRIPIRKLLLAATVGRFPSMLVLCLLGDGWSSAQGHLTLFILTAVALVLTITYLWNKDRIEGLVIKLLVEKNKLERKQTPSIH